MALDMSKEDREMFEAYIQKYEPYPEDTPEANQLDGDADVNQNRCMATLLKKLLDGKIK